MENTIKLNKRDTLKLNIVTDEGVDTGEYLEFDLMDIELPLIYQEMLEKDKKNRLYLKNMLTIIEKREDVKGKKLLTKNEEDEIRAYNEFFKKEIEIYNMFLGENGVQKLLNGRKLNWNTLDEINHIIEKYIVPELDKQANDIQNKIREKYKQAVDKQVEVLE